jgi:ferredoxin-NADP reductase
LLLLAAGSGITPLRALLLEALGRGWRGPITLGYWAQRAQSVCFAEQWAALDAEHPGLRVHTFLTRDPIAPAARINAEALRQLAPDLAERHVLACGPSGFVNLARTLSAQARAFDAEGFTPAITTVDDRRTVRVELHRQGITLDLPTDQPLLAALESVGQRPAHGCRQGICNTCACHRLGGASRDLQRDALATEPSTSIRLCVHAAADGLVLDL